jgi:hypothetical protein
VAYDRSFEALVGDIWESRYLHREVAEGELFAPLPEVPAAGQAEVPAEAEAREDAEQPGGAEARAAAEAEEPRSAPRSEDSRIAV